LTTIKTSGLIENFILEVLMVKLGKKHTCTNKDCGIKFYDLGKKEVICPRCHKKITEEEEKQLIEKKVKSTPIEEEVEKEEELIEEAVAEEEEKDLLEEEYIEEDYSDFESFEYEEE
jgi:hypothetical protein